MNCAEAYEYIVEAMAEYDPRIAQSFNEKTLTPDGKELIDYEPNLPREVKLHLRECDRCRSIAKLLEGKLIKRGEVAIMSALVEEGESTVPHFKGTPKRIIDDMARYYSQTVRDQAELLEMRSKMCDKIINAYGAEGIEMDENHNVTDIEFLKFCTKHGVIKIEADPWFILTERPNFLIKTL